MNSIALPLIFLLSLFVRNHAFLPNIRGPEISNLKNMLSIRAFISTLTDNINEEINEPFIISDITQSLLGNGIFTSSSPASTHSIALHSSNHPTEVLLITVFFAVVTSLLQYFYIKEEKVGVKLMTNEYYQLCKRRVNMFIIVVFYVFVRNVEMVF